MFYFWELSLSLHFLPLLPGYAKTGPCHFFSVIPSRGLLIPVYPICIYDQMNKAISSTYSVHLKSLRILFRLLLPSVRIIGSFSALLIHLYGRKSDSFFFGGGYKIKIIYFNEWIRSYKRSNNFLTMLYILAMDKEHRLKYKFSALLNHPYL